MPVLVPSTDFSRQKTTRATARRRMFNGIEVHSIIQIGRLRRLHAPRNWRHGYSEPIYRCSTVRSKAKGRPFRLMTRLLPFLILAGLAAELASIILVGNLLGVVPTLLLLLAGGVLGIGLIRSAGTSIAAALRSPVQASSLQQSAGGQGHGARVFGASLPGSGLFQRCPRSSAADPAGQALAALEDPGAELFRRHGPAAGTAKPSSMPRRSRSWENSIRPIRRSGQDKGRR